MGGTGNVTHLHHESPGGNEPGRDEPTAWIGVFRHQRFHLVSAPRSPRALFAHVTAPRDAVAR
jgi:hypothetical protein